MGQTGIIFFALLVGFVVYITVKHEMGAYLRVLGLGGGGGTGGAAETLAERARRTAAELTHAKEEASRINDSLKPIPGA